MSLVIKFYFTSSMLNMFRTLIHPSSGACDFSIVSPHWSCVLVSMCVGVPVWLGWGGIRVAGCSLLHRYHPNQPHRNPNTHRNKNTQPNINTSFLLITLLHVSMCKHQHYQVFSLCTVVTKSIKANSTVTYRYHDKITRLKHHTILYSKLFIILKV